MTNYNKIWYTIDTVDCGGGIYREVTTYYKGDKVVRVTNGIPHLAADNRECGVEVKIPLKRYNRRVTRCLDCPAWHDEMCHMDLKPFKVNEALAINVSPLCPLPQIKMGDEYRDLEY